MGKKSIKYFVFMFILIFNFNIKVNAAQELSCLYEKRGAADKVMLVQEKNGNIVVYKNEKDVSFDDTGWYVANAIPRWGDVKAKTLGGFKVDDSQTDDDEEITSLLTCPTAKITLSGGGLRFYKVDVDGGAGLKLICDLVDNRYSVITPESNDYNTSSTDVSGKSCSSFTSKEEMWNAVADNGNWATSCLYAKDVEGGCHIIRFDVNTDKQFNWRQAEPLKDDILNKSNMSFTSNIDSANVDSLFQNFTGNCPDFIYVNRRIERIKDVLDVSVIDTEVSFSKGTNFTTYNKQDQKGINQVTGGELTNKVNLNFQKIEILDCETLFGGSTDLVDLLKFMLNLIKILVPLLLIGLGTLDFAKAIFAGSEDNMKKAQSKFIKRVIIAVAIFLVPSILKLVLSIANGIWDNIDPNLCGLL